MKKEFDVTKLDKHPVLKAHLTYGQKSADIVTSLVGSWSFIIFVLIFMLIWIIVNVMVMIEGWDPYPFILLNFVLSCLAALQAPVILMSQKRQEERDRINARYDYQVNRKAEREIQELKTMLKNIEGSLKNKRS
ncbi:MAG: DUF1003 domain-containing protein [archaeon]